MGTLHEDKYTFMIISHSFLLRMKNVANILEKIITHILCSFNFVSQIVLFMRQCGKILCSQTGHRWQYGTCALCAR